MAKVLDCSLEISEFELQSPYYVHFRTNTLEKGMNLLIPQLCVKLHHCCSSTRMALALNPGRLIGHENKNSDLTIFIFVSLFLRSFYCARSNRIRVIFRQIYFAYWWDLTDTTSPDQSGSGSNSNEGVLHTSKISRTDTSASNAVYTQDTPFFCSYPSLEDTYSNLGLIPLQKTRILILILSLFRRHV